MAPLPQERRYSFADLLDWEGDTRYELYDGQPVALASPSNVHQLISGELFRQLANYLLDKSCKVYSAPFDVRLFEEKGDSPEDVDTVVQPDLMVVCDKSKVDRRGVHGAPDLVVEILSDSTRRIDRLTKFSLYRRAGVREYWIVDPEAQTVAVHLLEEGQYGSPDFYTANAVVPVSILEDCKVELSRVFQAEV